MADVWGLVDSDTIEVEEDPLLKRLRVAIKDIASFARMSQIGDQVDPALGSYLMGYLRDSIGASGRRLSSKLSDRCSAFDFIPASQHAAILAGTTAYDATSDVNRAIAELSNIGGGQLSLDGGTYIVRDIVPKSGVHLIGHGRVTLRKSGGADGTYIVKGIGSTGAPVSVTAPVARGAVSFNVASTAGIVPGGWVILRDETYVSAPFGRNQEVARVKSVAGTAVTLQRPTIAAYSSPVELVPFTPIEDFSIRGMLLDIPTVSGGNVGGGIFLKYAVNCAIEQNVIRGQGGDAAIGLVTVAHSSVVGNGMAGGQNMAAGGYGYGIELDEASHHCLVHGNRSRDVREHTFTNRTRFSIFSHNVCSGHYDTGFNTHGAGVTDCLVAMNTIDGTVGGAGIAVGYGTQSGEDERITIIGNDVRNVASTGISVSGSPTRTNRKIRVLNNHIAGFGLLTSGSWHGVAVQRSTDCEVLHNRIDGENLANAANGAYIGNASDVAVVGNRVRGMGNGYGLTYEDSTSLRIARNDIAGVLSYNVRGLGANSGVRVRDNDADDTLILLTADTLSSGNSWDSWVEQEKVGTVTLAAASSGSVSLVFDRSFTVAPRVMVAVKDEVGNWAVSYSGVSTSGVTVKITDVGGAARTGSVEVVVLARGR